jgi:DNA repair protein RadA/Sms
MVEFRLSRSKNSSSAVKSVQKEIVLPLKLSEIKTSAVLKTSSGISELDRVLGGGFVAGEVVLLAGEPGVGKSTLLLGLKQTEVVYVSGEESPSQIKSRADRLGVGKNNFLILAETEIGKIIEQVSQTKATLLVVDSVQTLWSEEIEGSTGSMSQVKWCTQKLIELAKKSGISVILIGQINKEGEIAGPMMLSHMVDCVLFLEGERFADLRLLRGLKNRFGPTDEVGVFKMGEKGMEEVTNPSELFLQKNTSQAQAGSVVVCAMVGPRPVLVEIQALVTQSSLAIPRRVVTGLDYNRIVLLAAVMQKVLHLPLYNQDIFVKVGGGFKISEPAADLGVCLAIFSSLKNKPIGPKTCVFGEVGLLGEIRRVNGEEKRVKEAKKLGFTNIISSLNASGLQTAVKNS